MAIVSLRVYSEKKREDTDNKGCACIAGKVKYNLQFILPGEQWQTCSEGRAFVRLLQVHFHHQMEWICSVTDTG